MSQSMPGKPAKGQHLLNVGQPPRLINRNTLGFDMQHGDGRLVEIRVDLNALQLILEAAQDWSETDARRRCERIARAKYWDGQVETDGAVLIRVADLGRD